MLPRGMSPSGVLGLFHGYRPQDKGRVPWYLPVLLGIKRRGATAAIARVLAGPQGLPLPLFRRGKQRLWSRDQGQVAPEVHDQQPVVAVHTEEAEYECFWTEYRAIHAARALRLTQDGVLASQTEQVAVQRIDLRVALALREVELRALERAGVFRVRQTCLHRRVVQAAKLCEGGGTPLAHQPGECLWEIGEIPKRA